MQVSWSCFVSPPCFSSRYYGRERMETGGSTNSPSTDRPRRARSPAPHTHPAPEILFKSCLPSYTALCGQSPATRILREPLTPAELSIIFSSTPLLFRCHLLSCVVTIAR